MGESIPVIDRRVEHDGVSRLRRLKARDLQQLARLLVLHGKGNEQLVVIAPYAMWLRMQDAAGVEPEARNA